MANNFGDVVSTVFSSMSQKLGDIVVNTSAPSGQIYGGSEFTGPPPSGVYKKYNHRFDQTNYYYPGRG